MTYLKEMFTCCGQWLSRQAAAPLQAVGLTPSSTVKGDTLLDEESADNAAERHLLGHLLDAHKTMLP